MKHQGLIFAGITSALIHVGAIAVIGASAASAIRGQATPQALEVQLPIIAGRSDAPQAGPALIETPPLPLTVNKDSHARLPETFGAGTVQLLPEVMRGEQSSLRQSVEQSIKADASDNALVAADLKLPTTYLSETELDVPPKALTTLLPEFPDNASAASIQGKVVLMVFVNSNGMINDIKVVEATPPGYFEASAIAAMKGVQFAPGQQSGQPVNSKIQLSINYGAAL